MQSLIKIRINNFHNFQLEIELKSYLPKKINKNTLFFVNYIALKRNKNKGLENVQKLINLFNLLKQLKNRNLLLTVTLEIFKT